MTQVNWEELVGKATKPRVAMEGTFLLTTMSAEERSDAICELMEDLRDDKDSDVLLIKMTL